MMLKTTSVHLPFPLLFYLIMVSHSIASITSEVEGSLANVTTLHLVQIIARHGDRAPILPYPNDLYKNASVYSINGWGELTELGAKQVYGLGSYLRQRYDGFLPRKYRKRDFLMLSSDIDRAIMSAEANLAGLYKLGPIPRSRDIFKEWQPVPIHTIPESEDNFINGKAHCPRYTSLYKQYLQSEEYTNFLSDNKAFIDFIVDKSGLAAITEHFGEIFQVQDALRCQHLHNLTLPSWVNSTVIERLEYFKALSFVWAVKSYEMKRLKVGPLFERLVGGMRAKVEAANLIISDNEDEEITPYQDPVTYRKMYIYSGHDSTISGFLEALNLFDPPSIPPYASAIIIELRRNPGSGTFFVELFYKNDTLGGPIRLDPLLFCGSSHCTFENFSNIAHNFIPSDWDQECQQSLSSPTLKKTTYSLPLMRTSDAFDPLPSYQDSESQDEYWKVPRHPLGMVPPGLSGYVLTVIAVTSLLASTVLLSSFARHACKTSQHYSQSSYVYQNMT